VYYDGVVGGGVVTIACVCCAFVLYAVSNVVVGSVGIVDVIVYADNDGNDWWFV